MNKMREIRVAGFKATKMAAELCDAGFFTKISHNSYHENGFEYAHLKTEASGRKAHRIWLEAGLVG